MFLDLEPEASPQPPGGLPPAATSRQCYNTTADGESLKFVPESFAVGGNQTVLPAVAVKGWRHWQNIKSLKAKEEELLLIVLYEG